METKPRFISVDTSALISFFNPLDSNHNLAVKILKSLDKSLAIMVTPVDAYSETLNTLWKKLGRKITAEVAEYLNNQKQFLLVDTSEIVDLALQKFKTAKKSPSFTDCIVMTTADKYQTKEIFGFDECFSKNGYILPT